MLKNILAITGKPGLYKLISHGNNTLIVESLVDGKRIPTFARDKIISLADVSMFTLDEDISLSEVLTKLGAKESLKLVALDLKNVSNDALREYFATVLPNYDRDRVYPSDIRKLIQWYNILINAGITDFAVEEETEESENEKKVAAPATQPAKTAKPAAKTQVKTQKAATTATKTGVGAKKG
ncbi:MAG: DUF5606 domain-containing protein [Paludibacteraceae bacterium]|nr:DUF5606 domain-containing protein [Paludibacteraceae bacterium]